MKRSALFPGFVSFSVAGMAGASGTRRHGSLLVSASAIVVPEDEQERAVAALEREMVDVLHAVETLRRANREVAGRGTALTVIAGEASS